MLDLLGAGQPERRARVLHPDRSAQLREQFGVGRVASDDDHAVAGPVDDAVERLLAPDLHGTRRQGSDVEAEGGEVLLDLLRVGHAVGGTERQMDRSGDRPAERE